MGSTAGQLLNLAVAACVSNDLSREAGRRGIVLDQVRVEVDSDYTGDPATSSEIVYRVEVDARGQDEASVHALIDHVDAIAEIPNSIREGTAVMLRGRRVGVQGH